MKSRTLQQLSKSITSGITPFRGNPEFWLNGTIPWLKTEQLGERDIYDTNEKITEKALSKTSIKLNPANTVSIAMYGEGKTRGNVSILRKEMTTNQACCNVVLDPNLADCEYVYYFLKNQYLNLRSLSSGVRKNLNSGDIKGFTINLPDTVAKQKKIAAVLSALDAKIALNHRINGELEGMAKLLYDYWFVQYDFPLSAAQAAALGKPRLAGKPYRSSGGPMVYHPQLKREIPKGWSSVTFDALAENYDSKRIPLSKEERNMRQGQFPYYGATSVMDYVDDYIFDGQFILLAEDGSIMDKDGFPIIQFIDGKSWVNNHAHVTRPRNMDNMEFLFQSLKRLAVVNIVTGSIQKKITQDNLNKVNLLEPDSNTLGKFAQFANPIRQQLLSIHQQNQELTTLRDWLLPMLMNGQVRVTG